MEKHTFKKRRKDYPVVNRSMQYRLMTYILVYCFAIVFFLGIALFLPDILDNNNQSLDPRLRLIAAERIINLHSKVWPAIIALVCLIGLHFWRVSSRIFGALYRIRISMEQAFSEGGIAAFKIRLRKRDYFQKEAEAVNEIIRRWAEKQQNIKEMSSQALESFDKMEHVLKEANIDNDFFRNLFERHRKDLISLSRHCQVLQATDKDGVLPVHSIETNASKNSIRE